MRTIAKSLTLFPLIAFALRNALPAAQARCGLCAGSDFGSLGRRRAFASCGGQSAWLHTVAVLQRLDKLLENGADNEQRKVAFIYTSILDVKPKSHSLFQLSPKG